MRPLPAPSTALPRTVRPARRTVLGSAWALYFLVLLLAPLVGPPLAVALFEASYVGALVSTAQVAAVGYVAGAALLLRPR